MAREKIPSPKLSKKESVIGQETPQQTYTKKRLLAQKKAKIIIEALRNERVTRFGRELVLKENPVDLETLVAILNLVIGEVNLSNKQRAAKAAQAKHSADPKQKAKEEVFSWWKKWRADRTLYKSAAKFAQAMLDKYPDELSSSAVIERWCREWAKSA